MKIFTLTLLIAVSILPLTAQHTVLYGTTYSGGNSDSGTIIRIDATTGIETMVYSFKGNSDGANPRGHLVTGPTDGLFYGTTYYGGTYNKGIIFSFDPVSDTERVLWNFGAASDGFNPIGDLIYDSQTGLFYGLTPKGGIYSGGIIFSFDPASGAELNLWSFIGDVSDGFVPEGSLVLGPANGLFYGMTSAGGNNNYGVIFSFNPSNNSEQVLYSFTDTTGISPIGSITYDSSNGFFYGMTFEGNTFGGTIFVFNADTNSATTVWNFDGLDGEEPNGSPIYDPSTGLFYGTTYIGGIYNRGTIFSFDPVSDTEQVLWSFGVGSDGRSPFGDLIYDSQTGLYYGLTENGGTYNLGTIFSLNLANNQVTVLHSFTGGTIDGSDPTSSLVLYPASSTGIKNISTSSISIYPNPTTGIVSITGLTSGQTIEVYDYLGEKVNNISANTSSQQLDLSVQESGIYLITISNRDGSMASQKKVVKVN